MTDALKLSGKIFSQNILTHIKHEVSEKKLSIKIVVILVGDNSASLSYIRKKEEAAKFVGFEFELLQLPQSSSEEELLTLITKLNQDKTVTGYIIQLPLPKGMDTNKLISAIDPHKDIDGFHPTNIGNMFLGNPNCIHSATPEAIVRILEEHKLPIEGKHVVILGRSNIVGKPLALQLINKGATVTVCNSKTPDLSQFTKMADILISATGYPHLIKRDMVKPGAVSIDVGCTFIDGKVVGDIDTKAILDIVSAYAPVPGGVGPGTVCMLINNALSAYYIQNHVS